MNQISINKAELPHPYQLDCVLEHFSHEYIDESSQFFQISNLTNFIQTVLYTEQSISPIYYIKVKENLLSEQNYRLTFKILGNSNVLTSDVNIINLSTIQSLENPLIIDQNSILSYIQLQSNELQNLKVSAEFENEFPYQLGLLHTVNFDIYTPVDYVDSMRLKIQISNPLFQFKSISDKNFCVLGNRDYWPYINASQIGNYSCVNEQQTLLLNLTSAVEIIRVQVQIQNPYIPISDCSLTVTFQRENSNQIIGKGIIQSLIHTSPINTLSHSVTLAYDLTPNETLLVPLPLFRQQSKTPVNIVYNTLNVKFSLPQQIEGETMIEIENDENIQVLEGSISHNLPGNSIKCICPSLGTIKCLNVGTLLDKTFYKITFKIFLPFDENEPQIAINQIGKLSIYKYINSQQDEQIYFFTRRNSIKTQLMLNYNHSLYGQGSDAFYAIQQFQRTINVIAIAADFNDYYQQQNDVISDELDDGTRIFIPQTLENFFRYLQSSSNEIIITRTNSSLIYKKSLSQPIVSKSLGKNVLSFSTINSNDWTPQSNQWNKQIFSTQLQTNLLSTPDSNPLLRTQSSLQRLVVAYRNGVNDIPSVLTNSLNISIICSPLLRFSTPTIGFSFTPTVPPIISIQSISDNINQLSLIQIQISDQNLQNQMFDSTKDNYFGVQDLTFNLVNEQFFDFYMFIITDVDGQPRPTNLLSINNQMIFNTYIISSTVSSISIANYWNSQTDTITPLIPILITIPLDQNNLLLFFSGALPIYEDQSTREVGCYQTDQSYQKESCNMYTGQINQFQYALSVNSTYNKITIALQPDLVSTSFRYQIAIQSSNGQITQIYSEQSIQYGFSTIQLVTPVWIVSNQITSVNYQFQNCDKCMLGFSNDIQFTAQQVQTSNIIVPNKYQSLFTIVHSIPLVSDYVTFTLTAKNCTQAYYGGQYITFCPLDSNVVDSTLTFKQAYLDQSNCITYQAGYSSNDGTLQTLQSGNIIIGTSDQVDNIQVGDINNNQLSFTANAIINITSQFNFILLPQIGFTRFQFYFTVDQRCEIRIDNIYYFHNCSMVYNQYTMTQIQIIISDFEIVIQQNSTISGLIYGFKTFTDDLSINTQIQQSTYIYAQNSIYKYIASVLYFSPQFATLYLQLTSRKITFSNTFNRIIVVFLSGWQLNTENVQCYQDYTQSCYCEFIGDNKLILTSLPNVVQIGGPIKIFIHNIIPHSSQPSVFVAMDDDTDDTSYVESNIVNLTNFELKQFNPDQSIEIINYTSSSSFYRNYKVTYQIDFKSSITISQGNIMLLHFPAWFLDYQGITLIQQESFGVFQTTDLGTINKLSLANVKTKQGLVLIAEIISQISANTQYSIIVDSVVTPRYNQIPINNQKFMIQIASGPYLDGTNVIQHTSLPYLDNYLFRDLDFLQNKINLELVDTQFRRINELKLTKGVLSDFLCIRVINTMQKVLLPKSFIINVPPEFYMIEIYDEANIYAATYQGCFRVYPTQNSGKTNLIFSLKGDNSVFALLSLPLSVYYVNRKPLDLFPVQGFTIRNNIQSILYIKTNTIYDQISVNITTDPSLISNIQQAQFSFQNQFILIALTPNVVKFDSNIILLPNGINFIVQDASMATNVSIPIYVDYTSVSHYPSIQVTYKQLQNSFQFTTSCSEYGYLVYSFSKYFDFDQNLCYRDASYLSQVFYNPQINLNNTELDYQCQTQQDILIVNDQMKFSINDIEYGQNYQVQILCMSYELIYSQENNYSFYTSQNLSINATMDYYTYRIDLVTDDPTNDDYTENICCMLAQQLSADPRKFITNTGIRCSQFGGVAAYPNISFPQSSGISVYIQKHQGTTENIIESSLAQFTSNMTASRESLNSYLNGIGKINNIIQVVKLDNDAPQFMLGDYTIKTGYTWAYLAPFQLNKKGYMYMLLRLGTENIKQIDLINNNQTERLYVNSYFNTFTNLQSGQTYSLYFMTINEDPFYETRQYSEIKQLSFSTQNPPQPLVHASNGYKLGVFVILILLLN